MLVPSRFIGEPEFGDAGEVAAWIGWFAVENDHLQVVVLRCRKSSFFRPRTELHLLQVAFATTIMKAVLTPVDFAGSFSGLCDTFSYKKHVTRLRLKRFARENAQLFLNFSSLCL